MRYRRCWVQLAMVPPPPSIASTSQFDEPVDCLGKEPPSGVEAERFLRFFQMSLFCLLQISPNSIAARDGRIREGDRILQVRRLKFNIKDTLM